MGDFNKNNEKWQRNTTGAEQEGMIFFSYFFRREKMFKVFASITGMILLDTFFLIEIHNS